MSPSSTSSRRGSTSPTIACRRRQASWPSPSAPPSSSRPSSSSSGGPTPTSPGLQVRKDHRLVTAWVYERVRHPMYSAHLLWAAAQLLLLQNAIAGPAFLVASLPLYAARIPREEEMMEEKFGGGPAVATGIADRSLSEAIVFLLTASPVWRAFYRSIRRFWRRVRLFLLQHLNAPYKPLQFGKHPVEFCIQDR